MAEYSNIKQTYNEKIFLETKKTVNQYILDDVLNYIIKDYIMFNTYDLKRQSLMYSVYHHVYHNDYINGFSIDAYDLIVSYINTFIEKLIIRNLDYIRTNKIKNSDIIDEKDIVKNLKELNKDKLIIDSNTIYFKDHNYYLIEFKII
jgi:hypothetical protein